MADIVELEEEIERSSLAWDREREHLSSDYTDAEIRSLLMSRARRPTAHQIPLALCEGLREISRLSQEEVPLDPEAAPQHGPILEIRRPGHPLAVAVYPGHCGGRPVVMSSRGVAAEDIVSRVRAGDTIEAVAADMDLDLLDAREAFIVGYVLEWGHLPGPA